MVSYIIQISLATSEGRSRALAAGAALRAALRAEGGMPAARRRLAAVRERLRRLARARDALAAALARHLNNLLIHLGNEAAAAPPPPPPPPPRGSTTPTCCPTRPSCAGSRTWTTRRTTRSSRCTWARGRACTSARCARRARRPAPRRPPLRRLARHAARRRESRPAGADRVDREIHRLNFDSVFQVLTVVENVCNAEQDFCTQFFFLDADAKVWATAVTGPAARRARRRRGARAGAGAGGRRRAGCWPSCFPRWRPSWWRWWRTSRSSPSEWRVAGDLPGRPRASDAPGWSVAAGPCARWRARGGACWGRGGGAEGGEARWARAALAAVAVAAKRGADRCVAERIAALGESARAAARRPKAGLLGFLQEFEELAAACEGIFGAGGRRADLDRWYGALGGAMLAAVRAAEHPRTPRPVLQLENYHRLGALLAARRVPALDALRRDARARYDQALRQYVTQYFGRRSTSSTSSSR
ncbi:hypothetical protein MSG28_009927 [Choristoneura fumiferana]|uniref:Uncharacterized protein n=1 Tax=Choristoneura fumiferana TaxID=7141 RepID=A0ACC0JD80_CHOFU|nr:hypothetical protein MSG28_009927 [Choristoneura fumiferana]